MKYLKYFNYKLRKIPPLGRFILYTLLWSLFWGRLTASLGLTANELLWWLVTIPLNFVVVFSIREKLEW